MIWVLFAVFLAWVGLLSYSILTLPAVQPREEEL